MGIFDKLKHSAMDTVMTAATSIGNKSEAFTFAALPESPGRDARRSPRPPLTPPSRRRRSLFWPCVPMPLTGRSVRTC